MFATVTDDQSSLIRSSLQVINTIAAHDVSPDEANYRGVLATILTASEATESDVMGVVTGKRWAVAVTVDVTVCVFVCLCVRLCKRVCAV